MSEWIKCSERMPPYNEGVLISDGEFVTAARLTRLGASFPDSWTGHLWGGYEWEFDFLDRDIRYWASLPAPPDHKSDA